MSPQEEALETFEALESQVLREVHTNSPLPRSSTASPAGKKPAACSAVRGSLGGSGAGAAPSAGQWGPARGGDKPAVHDDEQEHVSHFEGQQGEGEEVEDVFQSDGEGHGHSLFGEGSQGAAAAGISHPLARRADGPSGAHQPAPVAAQRRGPPPVYCDDEGEAEMRAEVGWVGHGVG